MTTQKPTPKAAEFGALIESMYDLSDGEARSILFHLVGGLVSMIANERITADNVTDGLRRAIRFAEEHK